MRLKQIIIILSRSLLPLLLCFLCQIATAAKCAHTYSASATLRPSEENVKYNQKGEFNNKGTLHLPARIVSPERNDHDDRKLKGTSSFRYHYKDLRTQRLKLHSFNLKRNLIQVRPPLYILNRVLII